MVKKAKKRDSAVPGGLGEVEWRERLAGLEQGALNLVRAASSAIERRQPGEARRALVGALALAPRHAEVMRLQGVLAHVEGRYGEAIEILRDALARRPDDALILNNLGSALRAAGEPGAAVEMFERATRLAPSIAAAWFNLGKTLKAQARIGEARAALDRAVAISPAHLPARIVLGDVLKALGDIDGAAASFREALRLNARSGQAWFSLANLKTVRFTAAETARLATLADAPGLSDDDRIAIGFANVKALEDAGSHARAFDCLVAANARKRQQVSWDARAFSRKVDAILAAFPAASVAAGEPERGSEVIFVVSLPRSGSTLTEQILAAHPSVEGASELPDLPAVLEEESRRRGLPFPQWAGRATEQDWERLGNEYLARTARWRTDRPRFTDKGLSNWQYVGAALAMLPAARVVVCRRDPVETCLSCFHQLFARGQEYSYDLDDLAAHWRDFDRLCRHWTAQFPGQAFDLVYENLLADPRTTTLQLLESCGLHFEEACLRPHESGRSVRTASAAQVREPLRRDTARAPRYGAVLDPLRSALRSA